MVIETLPSDVADYFWPKVEKSNDNCWTWKGCLSTTGYGRLYIRGTKSRYENASRVMWILTHGSIPDGLCVLHKCDNPKCVNPEHLFLGTKKDNTQDMMRKGRNRCGRQLGTDHWAAKLTVEDVLCIRRLYKSGTISQRALARKYAVSQHTIMMITTGQGWRHIRVEIDQCQ